LFTPGLQAAALARIAAWRARGRCPHAVEATAVLVELSLCDPAILGGAPHWSGGYGSAAAAAPTLAEPVLRGAYAMAVVRALNGLVDAGQQRGSHATSVQALAKRAGLPAWVVELRHDAAHNAVPSLPLLRLAATSLLRHLAAKYWAAQQQQLDLIAQLCEGIVRRFVRSHRSGVDDGALKRALADVPPSALATFLLPVLVGGHHTHRAPNGNTTGTSEDPLQTEGVLAPAHAPEVHPPTPEGAAALYWRCLPLLLALQARWAGFSEALLGCLVATLVQDEREAAVDNAGRNGESWPDDDATAGSLSAATNVPAAFAAAEAAAAATRFEAAARAAAARRFFREAWVRLLLSRDWLGRLLAPTEPAAAQAAAAAANGSTNAVPTAGDAAASFLRALASDPTTATARQAAASSSSSPVVSTSDEAMAAVAAAAAADALSVMVEGGVALRRRGRDRWTSAERSFMLGQAPRLALVGAGLLEDPLLSLLAGGAAGRLLRLAAWLAAHAVPAGSEDGSWLALRTSLALLEAVEAKPPAAPTAAPAAASHFAAAVGGMFGGAAERRARVLARVAKSAEPSPGAKPPAAPGIAAAAALTREGDGTVVAGKKRLREADCGVWEQVQMWPACALGALPGQSSVALTTA
jgi:hypothetical protein